MCVSKQKRITIHFSVQQMLLICFTYLRNFLSGLMYKGLGLGLGLETYCLGLEGPGLGLTILA